MISFLPGFLGGLGLTVLVLRKTFLGALIGVQLLLIGTSMSFVLAGLSSAQVAEGELFGFFIVVSGISQLVVGYSLSVRFFYLNKKGRMEEFQELKN